MKTKSTIKKDRIFILVSALVIANLTYQLMGTIQAIVNGLWTNLFMWILTLADIIAIIGLFYLIQNYRKRQRIEDKEK